jgi:hypothetical protein
MQWCDAMACHCKHGWICESHPDRAWPHGDCPGPAIICRNPECRIGEMLRAEFKAARAVEEALYRGHPESSRHAWLIRPAQ